ncbi:MAG: TetR/AcrR family transcriptional regulator [Bacteroidota bacterium]
MNKQAITSETLSTEDKIRQAAAKVFVTKGYAATKTRDIAEEAGINIASLHYYYRSKDKLFEIVIGESMRRFSRSMDEIFGSNQPLHVKIRQFVSIYLDIFKENPQVPNFVLSESQHNPEMVSRLLRNEKSLSFLKKELKDLAEQGIIRPVHHAQFILNLMGLTIFPFVAKSIVSYKLELGDEEYAAMIEESRDLIPDMIISYLYLKKP